MNVPYVDFSRDFSTQPPYDNSNIYESARASTVNLGDEQGLLNANQVANAIKNHWRQGETPDVAGVLAKPPGTATV